MLEKLEKICHPSKLNQIHLKCVCFTFARLTTIDQDCSGGRGEGVGEDESVEVDPDFANVAARLADCVRARVGIRAGEKYSMER